MRIHIGEIAPDFSADIAKRKISFHDRIGGNRLFITDPNRKTRLTMTYPMKAGRNLDEILRVIGALQTGDGKPMATPADWVPGGMVISATSTKDARAKTLHPQACTEVRPCLCTTML